MTLSNQFIGFRNHQLTLDTVLRFPEVVQQNCVNKGFHIDISAIARLERERRAMIVQTDQIRHEINTASKEWVSISEGKKLQVREIKKQLSAQEESLTQLAKTVKEQFDKIPNFAAPDVPVGPQEANRTIRIFGKPRVFEFEPKDHRYLMERAGSLDIERSLGMTGRGFYFLKGDFYKIRQALVWIFMDRLQGKRSRFPVVAAAT